MDNIDPNELEKMLKFLGDLRLSGKTNMFGAVPYLREAFPELGQREATLVLTHWMRTFSDDED